MNIKRTLLTHDSRGIWQCITWMILVLLLSSCLGGLSAGTVPESAAQASQTPTEMAVFTPTPRIWNTFAPASISPATPVPPPAQRMQLDDDVEVWLFLGSGKAASYASRTPAIHLLFVNRRLAKASLISIPGNLFVFIPGQTMQRINTAYPLGGIELLAETLAYNFGVKPDRYVIAHPGEFRWLVDDLGGLEVSVLFPMPEACGGLRAGKHSMNGEQAYCYVSYISGQDEIDRTRRQQQVLQLLFSKFVQDGRLAQLPILYASYQDEVETNFSLLDVLGYIPLALRLGDPQRMSYALIGWNDVEEWELPDKTQVKVLLPIAENVSAIFKQALAAVNVPSPLGEIVLTYEAQLTQVIGLTQTGLAPTQSNITRTPTPISTLASATPIASPIPGSSPTPTRPVVPTAIFPTSPYPIVTQAPTSVGSPYP